MSAVVTVPNQVLRTPTKNVVSVDKKLMGIIDDMRLTLLAAKNPEGVGLAAPQIGLSQKIFLMRPLPDKKIYLFINPQILKYSQAVQSPTGKDGVYEGCLSLPRHYAPIVRSQSVTLKYQTLVSKVNPKIKLQDSNIWNQNPDSWILSESTDVFTDFPAHIIQHETDHLNGIIFIDRVLEQNTKLYHVHGKTWEEITL